MPLPGKTITEHPRWPWKVVAAVTLAVAAAVVAVTVPTLLWHRGGDTGSSEGLAKALDVTNRSLAETRGKWQRCREELVGTGDTGTPDLGGLGTRGGDSPRWSDRSVTVSPSPCHRLRESCRKKSWSWSGRWPMSPC